MTITNVTAGALIDPVWGNSVADAINSIVQGTYTPSLDGIVVGTGGANTADYSYDALTGYLDIQGSIIFGTSGNTFPPALTQVTLPTGFTATDTSTVRVFGSAVYSDATGGNHQGVVRRAGVNNKLLFYRLEPSGTTLIHNTLSTTTPFTWANSDRIYWDCRLRVTYTP